MLDSEAGVRFAKYRARDAHDTKWIYADDVKFENLEGFLVKKGELISIYPGTFGEFSGFTDMNYVPIYDGDFIKLDDSDKTYIAKNMYRNHKWEWCLVRYGGVGGGIQLPIKDLDNINHTLKVIGNIWMNWERVIDKLSLEGIDPKEMERLRAKEKEEEKKKNPKEEDFKDAKKFTDYPSNPAKDGHIASQVRMMVCYAKAIQRIGEDLLSELDKEYE